MAVFFKAVFLPLFPFVLAATDYYASAEEDECALVQTKDTFKLTAATRPKRSAAEGIPPDLKTPGIGFQAFNDAASSLSTLSILAGQLAFSTKSLGKRLGETASQRSSFLEDHVVPAPSELEDPNEKLIVEGKQENTTSSPSPSFSNQSFQKGTSSNQTVSFASKVFERLTIAGNVLKDFALHGLRTCAGMLRAVWNSFSKLSSEGWAIIGTVALSLVCAAFLCYYIHIKGYVPPAFREKRKYISWEERQEQLRTQIAADPVLNAIGVIPRIIVHLWDFLACCKVFWCSCSADTFKWLVVIFAMFSFGCWQLWQSGFLQPVLNYLAVYLYFFAFFVALGILAIFEIWTRLRGGFINQIENLGKIQEKITSFERKLGLV